MKAIKIWVWIGGFFLFFLGIEPRCLAQNLSQERLIKVTAHKSSQYIKSGIFFNQGEGGKGRLNALRHFYSSKKGNERIVFDFDAKFMPKIYGFISEKERKLYIDMFQTTLNPAVSSLGNSYFVKNLFFYPLDDDSLTLEIELKSPGQFDIFWLENPGRLVIDVKIQEAV